MAQGLELKQSASVPPGSRGGDQSLGNRDNGSRRNLQDKTLERRELPSQGAPEVCGGAPKSLPKGWALHAQGETIQGLPESSCFEGGEQRDPAGQAGWETLERPSSQASN